MGTTWPGLTVGITLGLLAECNHLPWHLLGTRHCIANGHLPGDLF